MQSRLKKWAIIGMALASILSVVAGAVYKLTDGDPNTNPDFTKDGQTIKEDLIEIKDTLKEDKEAVVPAEVIVEEK